MKLVAVFLSLCIAGSLGSVLPLGAAAGNKAAVGVGKQVAGKVQVGDKLKDWRQSADAKQDWENIDIKKSRVAQNQEQTARKAAQDATARTQDYRQDASKWDEQKDAANRAAVKSAAAANAKEGKQVWSASNNFDKNQDWANKEGWRKGNRRHEGINYSFDKKFERNANDNGGYDAGSKLRDHALDDFADRRSSYDRRIGDHNARAANADRQSADRNARYGNQAWAKQAAADKFGRDNNQAAAANARNQDWAEKRDNSNTHNLYNEDQRAVAYDALNDQALVDRNANRNAYGYGAARDAKGVLGKGYGYGTPYGYGYAAKGVGALGKDLNRAAGQADSSKVWDNAQRNKNQKWAGDNWVDRSKDLAVANQWQQDKVNGFNKDQLAALHDKGYAGDAAARDQAANARNSQWAAADNAKVASQARNNLEEEAHLRQNKKWKQSDRDHKLDEWKKFYNNDQKGGQNWERLKYNRDQTDDAAAADFKVAKDNANKWQDGHRFDAQRQAARGAEAANARDASNRQWSQDWTNNANAAHNQAASAADAANKGVWGANNDNRKYAVEQDYRDVQNKDANLYDRGAQQNGYGGRAFGGARNAYGGANAAYPANNNYGYGYGGYPAAGYGNVGYGGYGNYGKRGFGYY